jgi:RNA polymerase sigma-70 factor (ECF subfamily)
MNGSTLYPGYPGIERRRHHVLPYFGEERRSSTPSSRGLGDEAFLLRRAVSGDREAFARLFDRFIDPVYKYVYFNVGDQSLAEQLTARVFMSAWQQLQRETRVQPPLGAWLYRLAHTAIAEQRHVETVSEYRGDDGRGDLTPSAEKEPVRALAQLGDEQRQVLVLRFLVGCTTEQVAQILGRPAAAIRSLQHRGLSGLGGILGKGAEK